MSTPAQTKPARLNSHLVKGKIYLLGNTRLKCQVIWDGGPGGVFVEVDSENKEGREHIICGKVHKLIEE